MDWFTAITTACSMRSVRTAGVAWVYIPHVVGQRGWCGVVWRGVAYIFFMWCGVAWLYIPLVVWCGNGIFSSVWCGK